MRKLFLILFCLFLISCNGRKSTPGERIITVSIAPFKYFIDAVAGDDFTVNVMVPAGSDPHVYEPAPEQINKLRRSAGYISNGYLGFEMNWLDRFYEANKTMKKLCLADKITPIVSEHQHEGEHVEGADPHYWVSPKSAMIMAESVKIFLSDIYPEHSQKYEENYKILLLKIQELDKLAGDRFASLQRRSFMIYHPNFAYIARDKDMIDHARLDKVKTIFLQREYDPKNAKAIANEIGAEVVIVDPLSEDWLSSTTFILEALYKTLSDNNNQK
jgi:zinc transport system substrate-binding protein